MGQTGFDHIPGLFVDPTYLTAEQCKICVAELLALYAQLESAVRARMERVSTSMGQPGFVRSAKHNLASDESYLPIKLDQAHGRRVTCEYFPRYGETGHALGYLQGQANLPDFLQHGLLDDVRNTMHILGLVESDQRLTWKLTLNFYRNVNGTVAGFPFHVDIPSNGVVTMILNVQREALFQIAKHETITDIELPVGSLLVLSGESRYEWKHRVLPQPSHDATPPGQVERVSLVLGFQ